jgi:hypothetical protein
VDVPAAWTGSSGHLLHEPWIFPPVRDALAALIAELEAAAPPGLAGTRTAFRRQGQAANIKALSPGQQREVATSQLLDLRAELLVAVKLLRAGALTRISKETPDFECSWQGNEFGIEVTTRARQEVGSAMHDLLEEGLSGGPDVGIILLRSGKLLFAESPAKTAAIAARVVAAIKEHVAAAAGQPITGGIQIPELGLTAMLHDGGPLCRPGMRVTYEIPLGEDKAEYHWTMAARQIKDPIEKKGRKAYALPSIVVLDVSRLGTAGQEPAGASWTHKFQDELDACQLGNLRGALVVRSALTSEFIEPLCWRGEQALAPAVAAVLLGGQIPKAA